MNRISIRGVGIAAAALVATSLAVGSNTPAADAQEAASRVPQASLVALNLLSTNSNTAIAFPVTLTSAGFNETAFADLVALHDARASARTATVLAQAQAAATAAATHKAAVAAAARAARARIAYRASRTLVRPVAPGSLRALGKTMAASRGWVGSQWTCLDNIWTRESGWSRTAANPSGAYGIPQASPGSKMASAGADWRTNAATQITWGLSYIANAYGNPCAAWSFWLSHNWY